MIGLTVEGRYRIQRPLGRGGMALVYLARDERLERAVAVKVLADNLAEDRDFRLRFLREAKLADRLEHPNVVEVLDSGETEGRPYIVMEHVEGTTLAEELRRRGRLAPDEAADLGAQVATGLAHAHATGIVHRDLKPQNLLLTPDGTAKIADFGIARAAEETRLTQVGTILGTAAYLAPEQAAGEEVTAAADIYSLGAVLYELLTGRPPHVAATLTELLIKLRDEPIAPPRELAPAVPEWLDTLVVRCLDRDPVRRPDAAVVAEALAGSGDSEELTQLLPGKAGPEALTVRLPRTQRSVLRTGAALAALAGVAAVLAVVLSGDEDGKPPAAPPPQVRPVPPAATPAEQARNLARWLRENAR